MSHMLDMTGNRANMAYIGEKPWHGLGVDMQDGASLDQWRVAAGLNWDVLEIQGQYQYNGIIMPSSQKHLVRSDNGFELGVVSQNGYNTHQPEEIVEFFRDLTEEYGMRIETMGALSDGKRIWALARTGDSFTVKGQDRVESYVLLCTSFDKTMATRAQFTSVRVVCHNTLTYSMSQGGDFISIPHSRKFNADEVKLDMGLVTHGFQLFENNVELLSDVGINRPAAVRFLVDIMEGEDADVSKLSTRKHNTIKSVVDMFDYKGVGSDLRSAKGTLWGLVNAVTEHVDHHQGRTNNTRMNSAWFGQGNTLKKQAFNKALALAKQAA